MHHRLVPFVLLAACGGAPSTGSTTAGTPEHHEPAPPDRPWAELSHDERRAHMVRHVQPVMAELFAGYDAERFADVSCETCHGADAVERAFAMPNPSILALYPTGSIGQYQMVERYPNGVHFMFTEVVPAMRTMLGAAEYDAATHTGFSCFACHPHAPDDDPLAQPSPSSALAPPARF
jgi:hypothetical protein